MAWLKKKFQGFQEKLEKEEKPKSQQLVDSDNETNYNKLDDVTEVGESMTSQVGDFKTLLAKEQEHEQNQNNSEVSVSDRESAHKGAKSGDSDRESPKKGTKSDSDRESGKKSSKSSPETEKKSGSEKKKKVKTHRRVSSASALSALGGFIKKGHKRERSDGGIVIDNSEKQEKRCEDHPIHIHAFDDSSALLAQKKKEIEKKERKEIELLFRADSAALNSTNPFRTSESPIPIGDEKQFTNMSFVIEGEEKEDTLTLNQNEDIKMKVCDNIKQWQMHSNNIDHMYDLATRLIEKRKADMMLAITEMANELQSQLQNRYAKETQEAKSTISRLHEINELVNSNEWNNCTLQISDLPRKPNVEPIEMVYEKDSDLKEVLVPIFGQIEIKPISQMFGVPRDSKVTTPKKEQRRCVSDTNGLLEKLEYRGSFVTKSSRDVRECGITDLTLTNDNELVVVDRHNKLVKVFDYKGALLRYIGRHSLKQPSRATVLPWNNQILVSDNASQTVNLYHTNGSILSDFATDLKFPIAHCIVGENQVAVVDFDSKEVALYTCDQHGGYSKTKTFPVLMECPAYITSTCSGHIVVSDWSCNKVKIFDSNGELVNQISKMGTGPGEFKKPQGVTGDCHGHIFVMEQTNHRIQILSTGGDYVHKYDRSMHDFGVPMCMRTTPDGHFIVCEYQGNVKLFKYMDVPNLGLFNYEAPPPRPTVPSPSNAIWPVTDAATKESESML